MENEISGTAEIAKKNPQAKRDYRGWIGRIAKQGCLYLGIVGVAYGFFQFSHQHLLQTVKIDGVSMLPTLPNAQCYLLNRVVYLIREPQRTDIVVLRDPESNCYAIKRVVARPGDSVYVQEGQIFVNGELLPEPYLAAGTKTYSSPHYRAQLWICGVDQYFVLGDNRNNSADSRVYGRRAPAKYFGPGHALIQPPDLMGKSRRNSGGIFVSGATRRLPAGGVRA